MNNKDREELDHKVKFIRISNSIAESKVDSLKDILTRVYLRIEDNDFLLDNGEGKMVDSVQKINTEKK